MDKNVPGFVRFFLLFSAFGLVPIALSYGAIPAVSLDALYGIQVESINLTHIMRAVMGLYLGMVVIWVMGAFKPEFTRPALVCCAVFMLGLFAGRLLSIVIDGWPHLLLVIYAGVEIAFGIVAIILLKRTQS